MSAQPGSAQDRDRELRRRLPWLLVFRAATATLLLVLTLAAELLRLPLAQVSTLLFAVVIGSYLAVVVLGLLLRTDAPPLAVATAYLTGAVVLAFMVVQGTGGVDSAFAFLYLLAILDGAIIGARPFALVVATTSTLAYGTELLLQLYRVWPATPSGVAETAFLWAFITHVAAFYLVALLAGHLAELLRRAGEAVSLARSDLVRARELQAAVLAALPVGVVTIDAQGVIRSGNARAAAILGADTELIGLPLPSTILAAVQSPSSSSQIALAHAGGARVVGIGHAPLEVIGGALRVVVLEDRTEVVALERALQAKERLASIGAMAAALAHELRNPLAAISGSIELLAMGGDQEAMTRLRDIVVREIDRLNRLVTELLVYARPVPAQRAPVDVAALLRDIAAVLSADAAWRDHALSLEVPESLVAMLDAQQVQQLLWNLLRNAVEASPGASPVQLRAKARADDKLVLEVRDFGPGLDPKVREHLFEPFRTTKPQGTGLGLAVVHRIVENHGGEVELVEADGGGTLARVILPG